MKSCKILSKTTDNIIELNEQIYAAAILVSDKISVLLRNSKRNTKPRWEIRLEGRIKDCDNDQRE